MSKREYWLIETRDIIRRQMESGRITREEMAQIITELLAEQILSDEAIHRIRRIAQHNATKNEYGDTVSTADDVYREEVGDAT